MHKERFEKILRLIPRDKKIVDIGTDHAYIPEEIIKRGISNKVIATEINQQPFLKAKDYIESKSLTDEIEIRKGDGFGVIEAKEFEVAIIAGMGGLLINKIIHENIHKFNYGDILILQPMSAVDKTRKFLYENNFKIIDEDLAKEDYHYYNILKVKYVENREKNSEIKQYIIGEILLKKRDENIEEHINKIISTNNKIILNINKNSSSKEKINALEKTNIKLKELLIDYGFREYN